jgi:hypothetical protein
MAAADAADMRNATMILAASALVLLPRLAHADDAPIAPAPLAPARSVVVIRDDGATPAIRSKGLVLGGVATGIAGVAMLIGGVAMAQTPPDRPPCTDNEATIAVVVAGASGAFACASPNFANDMQRTGGYILGAFGGLAVAGGVAMIVVGGMPSNRPDAAQAARGIPTVAVGPGSASLKWTF